MPAVIHRALISVSDKTNLIPFAQGLHHLGVEILSTGGTLKALKEAGIEARQVSDYTEFPEIMDGRVKTLHPKIFGGILGRRDVDHDVMQTHGIEDIDLVVVNLYPFEQTIAKDCSLKEAIEQIDIGGPSLIRAAAKNHDWTTVVVSPKDYETVLSKLKTNKLSLSPEERLALAAKAFAHTARYDGIIADHLGRFENLEEKQATSRYFHCQFELDRKLRYGENPQQSAAYYREATTNTTLLSDAELIQGKPLSFNNIVDISAALECAYPFESPSCVIVKHANPCGVATGKSLLHAYQKAVACDETSAFGGIIAFNKTVDDKLIEAIIANQFVEAICAPSFTKSAISLIQQKPNVRLLATGSDQISYNHIAPDFKRTRGGLLVQDWDAQPLSVHDCEVVTEIAPTDSQWQDMMFAWQVVKFVKSNAIVLAKDGQTLGIGAGQMSRVFSVEIAGIKAAQAGLDIKGCALASDAFFPFKDNIEVAHQMGVKAIIQPGGSMRDNEVIQACNQFGIAMILTGTRHFRH